MQKYSGMFSKVMSNLGASFRTHPTPAFPSGSQMQLLREESRRKPSGHTHVYPPRVLAHSPCWQRPPVAHSSTSARVEEVFGQSGTIKTLAAQPRRQVLGSLPSPAVPYLHRIH